MGREEAGTINRMPNCARKSDRITIAISITGRCDLLPRKCRYGIKIKTGGNGEIKRDNANK